MEHKTPPKVVLITAHQFGIAALNGLLSSDSYKKGEIDIAGLITLDQSRKDSTVGYVDSTIFDDQIKSYSVNYGENETIKNILVEVKPDFLLVIGWSRLIPAELLDLPKLFHKGKTRHSESYGCIGMHPTLLPIGRGRAPIPWTIIKGIEKSGVSCFHLEDDADSGGVICQDEIEVTKLDDANTLFTKCISSHFNLGSVLAGKIALRSVTSTPQNEENATFWGKRSPRDGSIGRMLDIVSVDRMIRATTMPYPGAFVTICGKDMIIDAGEIIIKESILPNEPGKIIAIDTDSGYPIIQFSNGLLICKKIRNPNEFCFSDLVEEFIL